MNAIRSDRLILFVVRKSSIMLRRRLLESNDGHGQSVGFDEEAALNGLRGRASVGIPWCV